MRFQPKTPQIAHPKPPETILLPGQVKRLTQWSKMRQKAILSAWQGVCSPRIAIKHMCLECCGEDRIVIHECADRCCPLWHFRPFRRKDKNDSPTP
jgi:hypothetical protein